MKVEIIELKYLLIAVLFSSQLYMQGQSIDQLSIDDFDRFILNYRPEQSSSLSQQDYDRGIQLLEEVYANTAGDPEQLNVADYYNVCVALVRLEAPARLIDMAFRKGMEYHLPSLCRYASKLDFSAVAERIPQTFTEFQTACTAKEVDNSSLDVYSYAMSSGLDPTLIVIMHSISLDDSRFRSTNELKNPVQNELDRNNQRRIDSLFSQHGRYLGKSLVGERFSTVMWQVIQHAETEYMEKYLPILHSAAQEDELSFVPLKMLLDRYYGLTRGYQFFGTQFGFGFHQATPDQVSAIVERYGIPGYEH